MLFCKELNEKDLSANTRLGRDASAKCEESSHREVEIDNADDLVCRDGVCTSGTFTVEAAVTLLD